MANNQTRTIEDELKAKAAEGKAPLAEVPLEVIEAIARQMEYGATKHGRDDWRKGLPWMERINSALRHLEAFKEGENIDPESCTPHLDAVLCQIAFLKVYTRTHPELDNRPHKRVGPQLGVNN